MVNLSQSMADLLDPKVASARMSNVYISHTFVLLQHRMARGMPLGIHSFAFSFAVRQRAMILMLNLRKMISSLKTTEFP